jgi:hypothetical protein
VRPSCLLAGSSLLLLLAGCSSPGVTAAPVTSATATTSVTSDSSGGARTPPSDLGDALPVVPIHTAPLTPEWSAAHRGNEVPASLRFAIDPALHLDGHTVSARGYLINDAGAAVEMQFTGGGLWLSFPDSTGIRRRVAANAPPPPPPLPTVLTLPGKSRILFQASMNLDDYGYPPRGTTDLRWTFGGGVSAGGVLKLALPATGPVGPPPGPIPPG